MTELWKHKWRCYVCRKWYGSDYEVDNKLCHTCSVKHNKWGGRGNERKK